MITSAELLAKAKASIQEIDVVQLTSMLSDPKVAVLDIRDSQELTKGAIPGAIHAHRGMLEFYIDRASESFLAILKDKDKLVMVCGSGGRAALATKLATDMGWNAYSLAGGMKAWQAFGSTD